MFLLSNFKLNHFYGPLDSTGDGPIEGKALDKNEVIQFLQEDDKEEPLKLDDKKEKRDDKEDKEDDKESKEDKEDGEKEDEEKDELDEIEEELDDELDEDKLELVAPVRAREILAKYPKIFKEFPHLQNAYYREKAFTEIVPTIADAKLAVEKADVLDQFEADLGKGNIENALKAVKGSGEDAFNNLVDNYLPNLYKVDKDAYLHVVGNITRQTINGMLAEAQSSNNAELKEAAAILNKFIFATDKITQPTKLSKDNPSKPEEDKLAKREQEFVAKQFEDARDSLSTKVTNVLKSTIDANIDKNDVMTPYLKKNASKDCYEKLESTLNSDKRLGTIIDKLWEQAFKDKFSKTSLEKIRSAYISRAKTVLPALIHQARIEALKGSSRRVKEGEEETSKNKGHVTVGKSTSSSNSGNKSDTQRAKEIPKGMSTRDFLMQD